MDNEEMKAFVAGLEYYLKQMQESIDRIKKELSV
jgi:hypothetical protein